MPAVIFLISISVFLATLAPGIVAAGDNAELITCAYTLGIAHPPGYPLFGFLGKLFCFLPFSTVAARVNLLSAFFGALTSVFVYLSIYKLTKDKIASAVGALSLSFSLLFWKYSIMAEVFTLNTLFAAAILYVLLLRKDNKKTKLLYLSAFLMGLGLANHHTLVFFIPIALIFIVLEGRKALSVKTVSVSAGLFLLGLLFYLYLPLRAAANPPVNWMDPQTWDGFKRALTRGIYGKPGFYWEQVFNTKNSVFYDYWFSFLRNFYFIGIIFFLDGAFMFIKRRDWFIPACFLVTGPLFVLLLKYDNNPIFFDIVGRFYILSFVFGAVLLGCGVFAIRQTLIKPAGYALPAVLALPLFLNLSAVKTAGDGFLTDFCVDTMKCCPGKSVLIVTGDSTIMGFDYLRFVEKRWPEKQALSLEKLSHKWYVDTQKRAGNPLAMPFERIAINQPLEEFISANLKHSFFVLGVPDDRLGKYKALNRFLVKQIFSSGASTKHFDEIEALGAGSKALNYRMRSPAVRDFKDELIVYVAGSEVEAGYLNYSNGRLKQALPHYLKAVEIAPLHPVVYKHLGKLYFELGNPDKSRESFKRFLELDAGNDPDRKTLETFVNGK